MREPEGTTMSSDTPENTASLMSMTKRGGSLIGKVVKLGFREPEISTVPPFTWTFLIVLSWTLSWARAGTARSRASPIAARAWVTAQMLPDRTEVVQRRGRRAGTPAPTGTPGSLLEMRSGSPLEPPGAGVLDEVLDVVADLPDVVPHRQLDVAVALHRPPEEIFAPRRAVDAAGRLHRRQGIEIAEDDRHRDGDVAEAFLVVVASPVAGQLPAADPPGELLDHLPRLALPSFAEEPADVCPTHPAGIAQPVHPAGQGVVERMNLRAGDEPLEELQPGVHRHVVERQLGGVLRILHRVRGRDAGHGHRPRPKSSHRRRGPALGVDRRHPGIDERAGDRRGMGQQAEEEEAAAEVRRCPDGDQPLQVVVQPGVAVAEHAPHGVAAIEDAAPAG